MEKWINSFQYDSLIELSEVVNSDKFNNATFSSGTQITDEWNKRLLYSQGYNDTKKELVLYKSTEWKKLKIKELRKLKKVYLFLLDESGKPKGYYKTFEKSYSNKPIQNKTTSKKSDSQSISLEEIVKKVIAEMAK